MRLTSHVAVVSGVYTPEPVVSAKTSTDIANYLGNNGWTVEVVTAFPNRPDGILFDGYKKRVPWSQERQQGRVAVTRVWTVFSRRSTMASRLAENASFAVAASIRLLCKRRLHVVYANVWPIVSSTLVALVAWVRRVPYVITVQDVYPNSLVAQRRIKSGTVIYNWLLAIDGAVARRARHVFVLSEHFLTEYLKRGVRRERLSVLPNWCGDEETFSSAERREVRKALGFSGEGFLCVYGGSISKGANVASLVRAFARAGNCGHYELLIAGSGPDANLCRSLAREAGLAGVQFLDPWKREDTFRILAVADLLLLPTMIEQSLFSVPSKLVAYMRSGRPILAIGHRNSELARVIGEAECGWVISIDSPEEIFALIQKARELGEAELNKLGKNGADYARGRFDAAAGVAQVAAVLELGGAQSGAVI